MLFTNWKRATDDALWTASASSRHSLPLNLKPFAKLTNVVTPCETGRHMQFLTVTGLPKQILRIFETPRVKVVIVLAICLLPHNKIYSMQWQARHNNKMHNLESWLFILHKQEITRGKYPTWEKTTKLGASLKITHNINNNNNNKI